ncbi:hypothetical protein EDEG_02847 [Edhazardia aedis USNM 41457]|uniref:Uncharacterized protein n=1 Tax=Edhazardia aedis (strain USNM 41457) TaxID=1003232 RepID=J9D5E4_EDHAE|nr:hypothetical protein EDEG_02847 [Edhazardia aedis USNM 41457]|eukprot:EJW02754.1 hypothetical protein EDEG_02847 [Edhazardia aedis USNM 41457]
MHIINFIKIAKQEKRPSYRKGFQKKYSSLEDHEKTGRTNFEKQQKNKYAGNIRRERCYLDNFTAYYTNTRTLIICSHYIYHIVIQKLQFGNNTILYKYKVLDIMFLCENYYPF